MEFEFCSKGSEQVATPNNASLCASKNRIIDQIKNQLEATCPRVISCADIIVLSIAIALELVGGPSIPVLMGYRDSHTLLQPDCHCQVHPYPQLSISRLKQNSQSHGLDSKDLVAIYAIQTSLPFGCTISTCSI